MATKPSGRKAKEPCGGGGEHSARKKPADNSNAATVILLEHGLPKAAIQDLLRPKDPKTGKRKAVSVSYRELLSLGDAWLKENGRPVPFYRLAGDDCSFDALLNCLPVRFHTVAEIRNQCQRLYQSWQQSGRHKAYPLGNAILSLAELWRAMRLLPDDAGVPPMPHVATIGDGLRAVDDVVRWCEQNEAKRDDAAADATHVKTKKSTVKGEAPAKILAALTLHHKYQDGSCLYLEPIGVKELSRQAKVSPSSVTTFFNSQFGEGEGKQKKDGHKKYMILCHDTSSLVTALKMLNGELTPSILLSGREPPTQTGGKHRRGRTPGTDRDGTNDD